MSVYVVDSFCFLSAVMHAFESIEQRGKGVVCSMQVECKKFT